MKLEHCAAGSPKTNIKVKKKSYFDDFEQMPWEDVAGTLARVGDHVSWYCRADQGILLSGFHETANKVIDALERRHGWARNKHNREKVTALVWTAIKVDIAGQRCLWCGGRGVRMVVEHCRTCHKCKDGRIVYTRADKAELMGVSLGVYRTRWAAREREIVGILRRFKDQVERLRV